MSWGVVAALAIELRPALRALRARPARAGGRVYHLAGPLIFAHGGVGAGPASRCAADLIEAFRPTVLVSTGFAGALRADLRHADLIVGGTPDVPADAAALRAALRSGAGAREGPTLAAPRVLLQADAKRDAARHSGALCVDMESAAVGRLARERTIGFLCVKAILDTVEAPLASEYEGPLAVALEVVRRPDMIRGVLADVARARGAARALARFYVALARTLDAGA